MTRHVDHPLGRIEVTRKRIRHLYLRLGEDPEVIRVSAPRHFDDARIRAFVSSREGWIRRQRDQAARRPPRLDGERLPERLHLLGRPYRLVGERRLSPSAPVRVEDDTGCIHLACDQSAAREALRRHCRALLAGVLAERVPQWAARMALPTPEWRIRRMKTRWGSCNIRERRIWLNLELVRMPSGAIDLVIVHELAHLIERGHNARFYALMDDAYPDWRRWESTLTEYGIIGL